MHSFIFVLIFWRFILFCYSFVYRWTFNFLAINLYWLLLLYWLLWFFYVWFDFFFFWFHYFFWLNYFFFALLNFWFFWLWRSLLLFWLWRSLYFFWLWLCNFFSLCFYWLFSVFFRSWLRYINIFHLNILTQNIEPLIYTNFTWSVSIKNCEHFCNKPDMNSHIFESIEKFLFIN